MRFNIKTTNLKLTSEISDYLDKKLNALDKLINPNDQSAHAEVEIGKTTRHHQTGDVYRAEINLRVSGRALRAEATAGDVFAAIDIAQDEMHQELLKHKERKISLVRRGARQMKSLLRRISPFVFLVFLVANYVSATEPNIYACANKFNVFQYEALQYGTTQNPEKCEQLLKQGANQICGSLSGLSKDEYSLIKNDCYHFFAVVKNDPNLCKNLRQHFDDSPWSDDDTTEQLQDKCYSQIALKKAGAELCSNISTENEIIKCYDNLAYQNKDSKFCSYIDRQPDRDNCYQRFSHAGEEESCNQIINAEQRSECLTTAAKVSRFGQASKFMSLMHLPAFILMVITLLFKVLTDVKLKPKLFFLDLLANALFVAYFYYLPSCQELGCLFTYAFWFLFLIVTMTVNIICLVLNRGNRNTLIWHTTCLVVIYAPALVYTALLVYTFYLYS